MTATTRRTLSRVALGLVLLLAVARILRTLQREGVDLATVGLGVALALGVLAVVVAAVLAVAARRAGALAARVTRQRPGSVVVPGFTTAETPQPAARLGAPARGRLPVAGGPVAVVATPTSYEVWGGRDPAPRWVLRRGPGAVTAGRARYGGRRVRAVRLRDGAAAAAFVPAYRPLRAAAGVVGTDVDRAVAELRGAAAPEPR